MIRCAACGNALDEAAPGLACGACGAVHETGPGIYSFLPGSERAPDTGYRDAFFETNAERETRHFWFTGRNAVARRLVLSHLRRGERFLEIGCGTGNMLRQLGALGYDVQGTDVSAHALRLARSRYPAKFYEADIARLPFEEHFPAAGLFDVLEHIEDDAAALRRVRNALTPGGLLFLTVPAGSHLFSGYDELLCHKRRYDLAPLRALVEQSGFSILKASYFFFALYPLLALTRRNRRGGTHGSEDAGRRLERELKIYPVANEAFRAVMACEAHALRFVNFPIGGSIALAARRA